MAGYEAVFKVIEKPKARAFGADRERMRREAATVVGPLDSFDVYFDFALARIPEL